MPVLHAADYRLMDSRELLLQKLRNLAQSLLLLLALAGLCGYLALLIGGGILAIVAVALVISSYLFNPAVSPRLILRLYRGRLLTPSEAPQLYALLQHLTQKAGLPRLPQLYYIPSDVMNAFATGSQHNSVIALSDGLLRRLNLRELTGVLAHELSHIHHEDLRVMGFADLASRFTSLLSFIGQMLLVINLPLLLFSPYRLDWMPILVLIAAPTLSALIQLALSRSREYNADLGAAELTGDPEGLASALEKMERVQGRILEQMILPGSRLPEPSLLRTHPPSRERIRRLLALREQPGWNQHYPQAFPSHDAAHRLQVLAERQLRPRWHRSGLWY